MVGWWWIATWARRKVGHSPRCWPTYCSTKWTRRWRREATAWRATPTTACVYVGSIKAGERVMAFLRRLYTGLKLQINEAQERGGQCLRTQVPRVCAVGGQSSSGSGSGPARSTASSRRWGGLARCRQTGGGQLPRWWRNSDGAIKRVLTIAYFDGLGLPRLS